jgi:diguanylate cyclase (GGDEF)-like protein/PAS domain S-box-containing protein
MKTVRVRGRELRAKVKDWISRTSITTHLVLMVLALGGPFLVFVSLSAVRQADKEREHARQQMLATAQLVAARLDDHVSNMQQLLATLSHVVGHRGQDTEANDSLLRSMQGELPEHIGNASVWTRAGDNIGSLNPAFRSKPFNIADREYFQETLRARGLVVEAPVASRSGEGQIAVFAFPVQSGQEVAGLVAATTLLKPLQSILDPKGSLPPGAVVTVVNSRGVVVSRSLEPEKWIGHQIPAGPKPFSALLQQRSGTTQIKSLDGVERVFGFSAARTVPWLVYVGVPTEAALAPVKARLQESLALGGILLLLGLVFAGLISGRISRALGRLGADAALLGQGKLQHRSRATMGGQIAVLTESLNHMAQALQDRTMALARSEQRLREITDNLPALVSYIDSDQRIRFANRAYLDWLGEAPDQIIGRSLREFWGDDTYEQFRGQIEAALRGAKVAYERNLESRRGTRHVQVNLVPHLGDEAKVAGVYAMIHDITERRAAELSLTRSEERLSMALEGSGLALFDWDLSRDEIYFSAQSAVFRGGPAVETKITWAELRSCIHPDDLQNVVERLAAATGAETPLYHVEYRVRALSGDWVWLRSRGRVVQRDASGRALRLAGTDAEVTQRKINEQQLREQAELDNLTGLPNRRLFQERLRQALIHASRNDAKVAVMFLDIDHFKQVNDTLGHEAGDRLLVTFAQRIRQALRKSDTVARLAGDEFTVIVEELHSPADAIALADKLVEAARRPVELVGKDVRVTTSIGIAVSLAGETDGAALVRRADSALYEAKRRGRNGLWMYSGEPLDLE